MSTITKASDALTQTGASLKSMVKLALQSRRPTLGKSDAKGERIFILGNGPSLRNTIAENLEVLQSTPTMAVNFAALADEFTQLRPSYYIMVDPHFFGSTDPKVEALWQKLANVSWPMTLIVPKQSLATTMHHVAGKTNMTVRTINPVGVEGWQWLRNWAYNKGLGMPRPRNVLIPAIMSALLMGYHEIFIAGADHSWMQSLWVNDRNEVVSVQPHFYKDDEREQKRVNSEYAGYRLHDIIHSFYVAFKSYHDIAKYASAKGVKIYNTTPGSYIDAFERKTLK